MPSRSQILACNWKISYCRREAIFCTNSITIFCHREIIQHERDILRLHLKSSYFAYALALLRNNLGRKLLPGMCVGQPLLVVVSSAPPVDLWAFPPVDLGA